MADRSVEEKSLDDTRKKGCLPAVCVLLALVVIRQLFSAGIPLFVRLSISDDVLMIRMAHGLINGDWLGDYYGVLLMKGCFFPMFLTAAKLVKVPYLQAVTLAHSAACVFFVSQVRSLIRDRRLLVMMAAVLLFDPCSFAKRSFQEVYRNSISETQVLFIFGAIIGLYLNFGENRIKDLLKAAFAGFMMWGFWNTREDAIWMLPFFTVALAVIAISAICGRKSSRDLAAGILILILPFVLLYGGNQWIKGNNLKYYGEKVRLECADGEFAGLMKTIYSVKPEADIPRVSVTAEKLERLYAVSPTLNRIRNDLDERNSYYSNIDLRKEDGEVEDGFFLWSLRWAADQAGVAGSLPEAQRFYGQIRSEIETALDTPGSGLERGKTMPSALMSPWKKEYAGQLISKMKDGVFYIIRYKDVETTVEKSTESSAADLFAEVTGNSYLREEDESSKGLASATSAVKRAAVVTRIYQIIDPLIFLAAAAVLIWLIILSIRRRTLQHGRLFLIIAGMWLSIVVMLCGVAYTDITAFPAVTYYYLAGAYPLMLAGECMILFYSAEKRSELFSGSSSAGKTEIKETEICSEK